MLTLRELIDELEELEKAPLDTEIIFELRGMALKFELLEFDGDEECLTFHLQSQ